MAQPMASTFNKDDSLRSGVKFVPDAKKEPIYQNDFDGAEIELIRLRSQAVYRRNSTLE